MFGRGQGGIEQAFLDYNEALLLAGHKVLAVTHPLAIVNTQITGQLRHAAVTNYGNWDRLCARRLRRLYEEWRPDVLISHGNRALHLNHHSRYDALHVGITHNYNLKHFDLLDAVIATTSDLVKGAAEVVATDKVVEIPNMVRVPKNAPRPLGGVPVIGAMGRMVAKKGFELLLQALVALKVNKQPFHLLLAGEGPEQRNLKREVKRLGLEKDITFMDWVDDQSEFFSQIDVFCLPSLHEPFGIVLLEAMAFGRPVVAFASEGPSAIVQNDEAWLVPVGDVEKLAQVLEALLQSPADQEALIERGRHLVDEKYALPVVSRKIDVALRRWLPEMKSPKRAAADG